MKKLILSVVFLVLSTSCFSQTDYSKKVNVSKIEKSIVDTINYLRSKNGVGVLEQNDSVKIVSNIECDFISNNGNHNDEDFTYNLFNVFGEEVNHSYHSNIYTGYDLSSITDWNNVEDRIVKGYINQYTLDGNMSDILITKTLSDISFRERIAVSCVVKNNFLYVSQVIYITQR